MRIDRIQITSLASLHGRQTVIDLNGPLLGLAGLVAITGPTGSGKSTILDGLSLALFGCTPRLKKDTEHLLSRDAIDGGAEVALTLDDGSAWVVSWSAHRKRRQLDEEVQPPTHQVAKADGTIVVSGVREVRAWVERNVRLTFDQFRGVMLLAQFDFARFLTADDGDRSLLLEKLTGTDIYARLSTAAFVRARQVQEEVQQHQQALAALAVLPPDERTRWEAALASDSAAALGADAAWERAQAVLAWWSERQRRAEEAIERRLAAAAAHQRWEAAAAQRTQLAHCEAALPFQVELTRLDILRAQAAEAGRVAVSRHDDLHLAQSALATGITRVARTLATLGAAAHAAAQAAAPGTALTRLAESDLHAGREALTQVRERARRLDELRRQQAQRTAALTAAQAGVALAQVAQREALDRQATALSAQAQAQAVLQAALAGSDPHLLGEHTAAAGQARRVAEQIADLHGERAQQDAAAANTLVAMREQARDGCAATALLAREQVVLAEGQRRQQESLAQVAGFAHVLIPGQPCPLCGSAEHPHPASADDQRLEAVRTQEQHARAQQQASELQVRQAGEALELARADTLRLQAAAAGLLAAAARMHGDWNVLRQGLPTLPPAPTVAAAAALLAGLEERSAAAWRARGVVDAAHDQRQRADQQVATAQAGLAAAETELARSGQAHHDLTTTLAATAEELAAAQAEVVHGVATLAHQLDEPLPEDAAAWIAALPTRIAAAWRASEQARTLIEAEAELGDDARRRLPAGVAGEVDADIVGDARALIAALRAALADHREAETTLAQRQLDLDRARAGAAALAGQVGVQHERLTGLLGDAPFANEATVRAALVPPAELQAMRAALVHLERHAESSRQEAERAETLLATFAVMPEVDATVIPDAAAAASAATAAQMERDRVRALVARDRQILDQDHERSRARARITAEVGPLLAAAACASRLSELIGSRDGARFRRFAQALTLDHLLILANHRLAALAPRYQLARVPLLVGEDPSLALEVIDQDQAEARRPVATLSGGETFLVSLALALALADLKRGGLQLGTLFIDEGFGSLDPTTLERCLAILERLQQEQGTQIIVISHVGALHERMAHRIEVRPQGNGRSRLRISSPEGTYEEMPAAPAHHRDLPLVEIAALWAALPADGSALSSRSLRQALGCDEATFKVAVASLTADGRVQQTPGTKSLRRVTTSS